MGLVFSGGPGNGDVNLSRDYGNAQGRLYFFDPNNLDQTNYASDLYADGVAVLAGPDSVLVLDEVA